MAGDDRARLEVLALARTAFVVTHFHFGEPDSPVPESGEELHDGGSVVEGHRGLDPQVAPEQPEVTVPVLKRRQPERSRDDPMETGA